MEPRSLRTFQSVVEEDGILSTSRQLNTMQSDITARIKRVETGPGAALFYRKGRGLELALSGRVRPDYTRQIFMDALPAHLCALVVAFGNCALRI